METKELMIGNWVEYTKYSHFPMQVVSLGDDYVYLDFEGNQGDVFEPNLEDMQPIEVTEDFLLKNCFEKENVHISNGIDEVIFNLYVNSCHIIIDHHSNSVGRNWYCHIDNCDLDSIGSFDFQYVHEFQNGIRLITKQDMDIKL